MKRTLAELGSLSPALDVLAAQLPIEIVPAARRLIVPFVSAIRRRCDNVGTYQALIAAMDWSAIDDIGRQPSASSDRATLLIELPDASLILKHRGAAIDHVYMAFDALVAAIVNITHTFARLVNTCYQLGIPERGATLPAIRDRIKGSPLGEILADAGRCGWLSKVSELRGRCQHADLEDVLRNQYPVFGRSSEPCVPAEYDWSDAPVDLPLTKYTNGAVGCADSLMCDCLAAIVKHGVAATRCR